MTVAAWLESVTPAPAIPSDELLALREELEDDAAAAITALGDLVEPGAGLLPLRLPKRRLADLERCERSALAHHRRPVEQSLGMATLRGRALDQFVAHQLVAGLVREPLEDLHAMLDADGDWDTLAVLEGLDPDDARTELAPLASASRAWAGLDPAWVARTQSRASLLLADGRCRCEGIVDVELGGPGTGRPSVLIEVKSGDAAASHPHEAYLYGLLVALRDGEAPAVVARWYPGADPVGVHVTVGVLEAAAARLAAGIARWARLLGGATPHEQPGGWCAWCPDRDDCPSARTAGRHHDGGNDVDD